MHTQHTGWPPACRCLHDTTALLEPRRRRIDYLEQSLDASCRTKADVANYAYGAATACPELTLGYAPVVKDLPDQTALFLADLKAGACAGSLHTPAAWPRVYELLCWWRCTWRLCSNRYVHMPKYGVHGRPVPGKPSLGPEGGVQPAAGC